MKIKIDIDVSPDGLIRQATVDQEPEARTGFLIHGVPLDYSKLFEEVKRLKTENEKLRLQAADDKKEVERWTRKHEWLSELNEKNAEAALKLFNKVEKVKEALARDVTACKTCNTILAIVNEP